MRNVQNRVEDTFEEESEEEEEVKMAQPEECTFRNLSTLDVGQQSFRITYSATSNFELMPGLIKLLPTFHGCAGEDPRKKIKKFHIVCDGMRPHSVTKEQLNLCVCRGCLSLQQKQVFMTLKNFH